MQLILLNQILSENFLRAFCWTLIHSLWEGMLLAMVAGMIMVMTRKASPAIRYNLFSSLFLLFITISSLTFYWQLGVNEGSIIANGPAGNYLSGNPAETTPLNPGTAGSGGFANFLNQSIAYLNEHASIAAIWFIVLVPD